MWAAKINRKIHRPLIIGDFDFVVGFVVAFVVGPIRCCSRSIFVLFGLSEKQFVQIINFPDQNDPIMVERTMEYYNINR